MSILEISLLVRKMIVSRINVKFFAASLFIAGTTYFLIFFRSAEIKTISRKVSGLDFEEFLLKSKSKNVFFVETRKDTDNVEFTSRMACSIESAARVDSESKVVVFYTSFERLQTLKMSPIRDAVLSYSNVFIDFVNLSRISAGSPMEEFMKTDKFAASQYPIEHLADATRLLVLWKFGGVYIDGDVIVRRSFNTVPSNFVCRQDNRFDSDFANGVLGFNRNKDGLKILEMLMKEFAETYDPMGFASNGPGLVTRIVKQLCGIENMARIMLRKSCEGFSFLKPEQCYAVGYGEWPNFMTNNDSVVVNYVMNQVKESLAVHFWNRLSKNTILETHSSAPYIQLARQFCPRVLNASGDFF